MRACLNQKYFACHHHISITLPTEKMVVVDNTSLNTENIAKMLYFRKGVSDFNAENGNIL